MKGNNVAKYNINICWHKQGFLKHPRASFEVSSTASHKEVVRTKTDVDGFDEMWCGGMRRLDGWHDSYNRLNVVLNQEAIHKQLF